MPHRSLIAVLLGQMAVTAGYFRPMGFVDPHVESIRLACIVYVAVVPPLREPLVALDVGLVLVESPVHLRRMVECADLITALALALVFVTVVFADMAHAILLYLRRKYWLALSVDVRMVLCSEVLDLDLVAAVVLAFAGNVRADAVVRIALRGRGEDGTLLAAELVQLRDLSRLGLGTATACYGAGAPIGPVVDNTVDGARLVVAGLGLRPFEGRASLATTPSWLGNRASAGCRATAARLGAGAPGTPLAGYAVERFGFALVLAGCTGGPVVMGG